MHISHDFIATKTCPSYEFLVVFGQVRVWDQKSAGRERVGSARVRAKFLKLLRGGFKFCGCGAHGRRQRGGQWCPPPHLNSVPPISCLVLRPTTKL